MTSTLERRWAALSSATLPSAFQLWDASHAVPFYIGKDIQQHRLLLLVTPQEPPVLADMRAIQFRSLPRGDQTWSFLLILTDSALAGTFAMLCDDLIESSRVAGITAAQALPFVLARISAWRRLLESGLPDRLTEPQIRGLCGELLVLRDKLDEGDAIDVVRAWVGPLKAPQDFQQPGLATEVKTVRPGSETVLIASEEQLQNAYGAVRLVVVELDSAPVDSPVGITLNNLIASLASNLASNPDALQLFESRLHLAGYKTRPEYDQPVLAEGLRRTFDIAEGFPRLTTYGLPSGVTRVSYQLSLDACAAFLVPECPPPRELK